MATTFDIVVTEKGIKEIDEKLKSISSNTRLVSSSLNNLNSKIANISKTIKSIPDISFKVSKDFDASGVNQKINAISRTIRSIPKANLNLFQGFTTAPIVKQIDNVTNSSNRAKVRVDALGQSLKSAFNSDLSPILSQIRNVADALERAARASRDIRPPAPPRPGTPSAPGTPPLPPVPPMPPTNAPQVTAAWTAYAKGVALMASIGLGVTGLVQMSDEYTNLKNRIQSVAFTTEQGNAMLERTFQIANAAQAPVAEVGNAYARYYRALAPLGYTSQQVADVTETVAKALKLSGATASEAGSVMLQLSQAFSKGKLDGDEFRSVLENFPGIAQELAKALDIKPVGDFMAKLFELKEEGKITSVTMVDAVTGMKQGIDEQMADVSKTFGGSIQVLKNSATEFFGELGQSSGVVDRMASSILILANNFDIAGKVAIAVIMGLAVTAIPLLITGFKALTATMMANPFTAIATLLTTLIAYLAQTEEGFKFLKNTVNVAFNAIYNIVAETVNVLIRTWNTFISALSTGMSYFSESVANSINQAKSAQLEMRSFMQNTTWSPDYKAPEPTGVIGDIVKGADGALKSVYNGITATTTKTKEYYATLQSANQILRDSGKVQEGNNLLLEGAVFNEQALQKATKIVAEQEKRNQKNLTEQAAISDYRKKAEEASHQRKIQTLTREATQMKDINVQQRAKNQLVQEELNLSLSKFAGKKGFEGAKNAEDVKKIMSPSTLALMDDAAKQTVTERLGDATQSLGVSNAIKKQNAKPKKESNKATEASEYARLTNEILTTTAALGKYGLQQDVSNKLAQIDNQLANKELKLLPQHRTELERLLTTQVREQAVQKASEKIYDSSKGAVEQLKIEQEGLDRALKDKLINQERYNELLEQNKVKLAELNIQNKMATDADYALIASNEKKKASEELYNQILRGNTNELAKLTGQEEALTRARNEGLISQNKYNQEMLKSALARQEMKLDSPNATFSDAVQGGFMDSVSKMGAGLPQVQKDFSDFFTGINEGFADSIGKAIVMGEDLSTSLSNVAKQGLADLLSGLIKIGIQWLLMEALKETLGIGSMKAGGSSIFGGDIFGFGTSPANQNNPNGQQQKAGVKIGAYNNVPTQGQSGMMGGGQGGGIPGQIASIGENTTKSLGEATTSFEGFFSTVSQGFTTVFGDANKQTQDLSMNISDVANNALNTLISSLVQVGIQWLIMEVIGQTIGQSAATSSAAQAGTVAAAWAPAAAMASLATLGSNAIPAGAAIVGVNAIAMAIGSMGAGGFKDGGYTGNGGVNDIAGVVHRKEFVMPAQATAKNRPLLEHLKNGGSVSGGYGGSTGGSSAPKIVINNMGTPQSYSVESVTRDEIRMIANDVAEKTVAKRTPEIMSNQVKNPNSHFSKTLQSSTKTERRRTG
jgi:tape measure domain-containing protein